MSKVNSTDSLRRIRVLKLRLKSHSRAPTWGVFEHRTSPLLPRKIFYRRVGKSLLLVLVLVVFALAVGMIGYRFFEVMPWVDSFANASMILSGMGPLSPLHTTGGKIFAGCYALFSGLVFIAVSGILTAPIAHRLLHKFHLEVEAEAKRRS